MSILFNLYDFSPMLLGDGQETPVGSRCSPLANFSSSGCRPATTVRPRVSRNCTNLAAYRIGTQQIVRCTFFILLVCYICWSTCDSLLTRTRATVAKGGYFSSEVGLQPPTERGSRVEIHTPDVASAHDKGRHRGSFRGRGRLRLGGMGACDKNCWTRTSSGVGARTQNRSSI